MIYFAVVDNKNSILMRAKSLDSLQAKIQEGYRLRGGLRPKGSEYTMEDYMEGKRIAKVTFEILGETK